jgi:hypothetical protein
MGRWEKERFPGANELFHRLRVRPQPHEGELIELATCKEYLQVRKEGPRQVKRKLKHYNLEVEPNFNF